MYFICFFALLSLALAQFLPLAIVNVTTLNAGEAIVLHCPVNGKVTECRWTWAPLDRSAMPITVKQFPPIAQDCSMRLSKIQKAQEGLWACSGRNGALFHRIGPSLPIKVLEHVIFANVSRHIRAPLKSSVVLPCVSLTGLDQCKWIPPPTVTEIILEPEKLQFPPSENNCSLTIEYLTPEFAGNWTCMSKTSDEANLTSDSAPIFLEATPAVEFEQVSTEINKSVGEPVLLHCLVSRPIENCRWSWRPAGQKEAEFLVIKTFPGTGDENRDCTVRFNHILQEQAGEWSCAAKVPESNEYFMAPTTILALLPPASVQFYKEPEDVIVEQGLPVSLSCMTTTTVNNCTWIWRSDYNDSDRVIKEFSASGPYNRDCSLYIKSVLMEQKGQWKCQVHGLNDTHPLESRYADVNVLSPVVIKLREISVDINIPLGSPLYLHCVTESAVDECVWTWKMFNQSDYAVKILKQFPSFGIEKSNCSVRYDKFEENLQGIWNCGAKTIGQNKFTYGPVTKVTLLHQESVMVALWSAPQQQVTLACRLGSPHPTAVCNWQHPPNVFLTPKNVSKRYTIEQNMTSGMCTLVFSPSTQDLGQWTCSFTVQLGDSDWNMASATLVLLNTAPVSDDRLGVLVGVLAAIVLVLILLFIIVTVYKCCKRKSKVKSTIGNNLMQQKSENKSPLRYTDPPTKINFQFKETSSQSTSKPCKNSDANHIYEQVEKYCSPTTSKSIYENVK